MLRINVLTVKLVKHKNQWPSDCGRVTEPVSGSRNIRTRVLDIKTYRQMFNDSLSQVPQVWYSKPLAEK